MDALGTDFTIACPAFPEAGRTICRGYLFVGDVLLSESGMKDHPLTPMTDANLVRVLQAQTRRKVGLIRYDTLAQGAGALRERIAALKRDGIAMAIADALSEKPISSLHRRGLRRPAAGDGRIRAWASASRSIIARAGRLGHAATAATLPRVTGHAAVLSGSCSVATNGQVALWMQSRRPALRIDPRQLAAGQPVAREALDWADVRVRSEPVLIYATATPEDVKAAQREIGVARAGALVEQALAEIAKGLVKMGVRKLVVAGGETAGAVVGALGVTGSAHRPADRSGRAVDREPRCRADSAGAQVRQFRQRGLLLQGAGATGVG